jgi:NSS family neurotransmitter:Na+ symporter
VAHQERGNWRSQFGFIMAASGSAIGLGNIVFFSANAYKYGAGAFYLPYLVALIVVGIPVMILEFGLGHNTRRAFPQSLYHAVGKPGEFVGWWAILNAGFITMYYITILAWVLGMWVGSFGSLFDNPSTALPAFAGIGELPNPMGFFFAMLSSWWPVIMVLIVWVMNVIIVWRGTDSIERAVKFIVPLMWVMMLVLIFRGLTLENGLDGILMLFTPNVEILAQADVWKGAFSQMFFTLSLGFGIMTAYASYLPKKSDQVANSLMVSFMNCSFEFIAGLAIFSLLFVFVIQPKASTLSMMFFIVPTGIAQFPAGVKLFGVMFFTLLLVAGLSSSVSLVEALVSAAIDKFKMKRGQVILIFSAGGLIGSCLFALPQVIDPGLNSNGTLGLSLLDLIDHWAFSYGLPLVGLIECLLIGWLFPISRLREMINKNAKFKLSPVWDWLVKLVIPLLLAVILGWSLYGEISGGIYGHDMETGSVSSLHLVALAVWLMVTLGGAVALTFAPTRMDTVNEEKGAHHVA